MKEVFWAGIVWQRAIPSQPSITDSKNKECKIYGYLNPSFYLSELCGHIEETIMFLYVTGTDEK